MSPWLHAQSRYRYFHDNEHSLGCGEIMDLCLHPIALHWKTPTDQGKQQQRTADVISAGLYLIVRRFQIPLEESCPMRMVLQESDRAVH